MVRTRRDASAGLNQEHVFKGGQSPISNGAESRPLDAPFTDGPNPEEHVRAGISGCTPANPEDLEGKITDDEGRQYTVRSVNTVRWSRAWKRERNIMAMVVERLIAVIRR